MANLVHNLGFDLPVYDAQMDVFSKNDLHVHRRIPGSSFVREVRIRALGFSSLREALDATDIELKTIADLTGTTVIDHEWGLYRLDRDHPQNRPTVHHCHPNSVCSTPDGYMLVARVPTVYGARKLRRSSRRYKELDRTISEYEEYRREVKKPRLTDMNGDQFLKGLCKNQRGLFLVDIEPRIQK